MEFLYTKNPESDTPIIVIDKHIGYDQEDGEGIMGGQFMDEFFQLKQLGKQECEVWVNTPGGNMMHAYDMAGVMDAGLLTADTLCIGMAASCGGWVLLKGRKVRMMDYSTFMCHDPQGDSEGMGAMKVSVARQISEGSGRNGKPKLSVDEALSLMAKTTFLTAHECLEMGLCDEVVPSGKNAPYSSMSNKWMAGKQYLNSTNIFKNNTMANLQEITNALDLNEEASDKAIAKAISKLKNEMDTAKKEAMESSKKYADLKNEMDKMNDYDDLHKKVNELTDKCNTLEADNKKLTDDCNAYKAKEEEAEKARVEAENKAKEIQLENDCKNLVNGYKNRIGSDEAVVNEWVNTAKKMGVDTVKNMLDKLPVYGRSSTIKDLTSATDTSNVTNSMQDALNKIAEERKSKKEKK